MANNDGSVKIGVTVDDSEAKKKLNDVEEAAEEAKEKIEDAGDGAKKSGKGFNILDVAMGNLVAGGISGLISGIGNAITSLVNLADETREYREDMAKLDTAFKTAGHSVEAGQEAYEDFYAILGESDRSVEAVNHLAELTNNTEELSKWSTIAAGVTAKFGDSLPIEGLTEAANETAKVGQTTGVLADALNWVSKDSAVFKESLGGNKKALAAFNKALKEGENVEDAFTAALGKMSTEQERSAAITNTLNGIYADAATEYNAMTAETQKARRATAEMEAAQARLGAAFEPVKTIVTETKAAFFNLAADLAGTVATNIDAHLERTTGLDTAQRALRESVELTAQEMRDMYAASDEAAQGINSQYDYVQKLADELFRLADETGKVTDADKARAEFILGELAEATGEEYTMTGNQIQKYGELKQSINDVINAKRAELLLAEYEEEYTKALAERSAAEQAAANQSIVMIEAKNAAEEAALNEQTRRAELEKELMGGVTRERAVQIGQILKDLAFETSEKQKFYEEQAAKYQELDGVAKTHSENIAHYEEAKTLILGGKTEEAIKYIDKWRNGYISASGDIVEQNKKEKQDLEAKVVYTSVQLGLLEKEYEEKHKGMTDAQKKEMQNRIAKAKEEAQKAREEYYAVGGDSIEGLVKGVEDKDGQPQWNLAGKLAGIVKKGIEAARKAADSHSPARETIALGEDIDEGLIIGVKNKEGEAVGAIRGVGNAVIKEATKKADEAVKMIEKKIEHLDEIRTTANAKTIDAQKKTLKKELDVAKERQKAMSDFANKYEKQLSDINKLEENYASESKRIYEQLEQDIAKVQEDYQNTFNNQVNAIRSSLGLFDVAEKGEAVKTGELTKALKSQVTILEQYDNALGALAERDVNPQFIEEISNLGVDYLPQIQAINKMTDEELSAYVKLWEEKTRLATEAATKALAPERERMEKEMEALKIQATEQADALWLQYHGDMLELIGQISTDMKNAGDAGVKSIGETLSDYVKVGSDLMLGIAQGMAESQSTVTRQAVMGVMEAINAAKAAAGIHSPSTLTRDEVGANLADGVGEGWELRLSKLRAKMAGGMSDLTANLRATVNAENARFARPTAAPDTGFADLARAVGIQTAGINSLAHEYRSGAGRMRPIIIELNKRELGRAVVDVGTAETVRVGSKLGTGGAR